MGNRRRKNQDPGLVRPKNETLDPGPYMQKWDPVPKIGNEK